MTLISSDNRAFDMLLQNLIRIGINEGKKYHEIRSNIAEKVFSPEERREGRLIIDRNAMVVYDAKQIPMPSHYKAVEIFGNIEGLKTQIQIDEFVITRKGEKPTYHNKHDFDDAFPIYMLLPAALNPEVDQAKTSPKQNKTKPATALKNPDDSEGFKDFSEIFRDVDFEEFKKKYK